MIRQFHPPTEESRRGGDDSKETLSLLPTEPLKRARRNTKGAKEHWDQQFTAEQPQEKEPQHGSLRRRSGG
ncbi:hypothetical protein TNCV_1639381 [Trichonephila clavipes]|nr:hypothetical protein TNCV_1639381 [Trichonephila clavipes]